MNYISKSIFILLMIASSLASASLSDKFSDHFSDVTVQTGGAGTFELSGRTLHSGGYVRVRLPVVGAPNPIRFQAPSIKGGCNGFDIYGGSFSYISAEEIINWLNAVIDNTGALGTYMFLTFLQEQCSVCGEVMQTLYAMQDMLNMTMQDSCSTASAIVDGVGGVFTGKSTPAWDSYAQGVQQSAINFSGQVSSVYEDVIEAKRDSEESVSNLTTSVQTDANKRNKELYGGNMLYWIVEETNALDLFKSHINDSTISKDQLLTYLVAIVGNQVDFIDESATDTQVTNIGTYKSNVKIEDFITSSYVENTVPSDCGGSWPSANFCVAPANIEVKAGFADVKPFIDTFKCVMEGEDSKGATCGSGIGIIGKLGKSKDDVGTLSIEEEDFIRDFLPGFNFGAMMVELSTSEAAMTQFYECTSEIMMNDFAHEQMKYPIELVIRALEGIDFGTGNGEARKSAYEKYLKTRLNDLRKEFMELNNDALSRSNCNIDVIEKYLKFKEYAEQGGN